VAAETDKGCSIGWLGFTRVETRRRPGSSCSGCWPTYRKNCWTIAEHAGDSDPHGIQHLLGGRDVHRGRLGAADDNTMSAPTTTAAASTDPHGPRTAIAVSTEALQRLLYGDLDTSRHARHIDWAAPCNLAANQLGSVVIMVKQGVQVPPRVESYARD
jgi:hypothetical protein